MPSRLCRRRFLLAVTTNNPALVRKAAPRTIAGRAADTRTPLAPPEVPDSGRPGDALTANAVLVVSTYLGESGFPTATPPDTAAACGLALLPAWEAAERATDAVAPDLQPFGSPLLYGTYVGGPISPTSTYR